MTDKWKYFNDLTAEEILKIAFFDSRGGNLRPHPDKQEAMDYMEVYYRGQLDLLKAQEKANV